MNKKLFVAACMLLAASCSNDESLDSSVNLSGEQALAPVTVSVSGFAVSQEEFSGGTTRSGEARGTTRAATAPASYSDVKALTLAFYTSDGARQVYCFTQLKNDNTTYTTLGSFSLTLPVGSYKMIVLGYNSDYPVVFNSMTDVVFGEDKSRETFCYTQDVTIDDETPVDLTATLNRIVTRLNVQSSDNRTEAATKVRISLSKGGRGFNPITGFATSDAGFVNVVTTSTAAGATTLSSVNFFITEEGETMDVTIETLDDEDNVLFSKVVTDVSFRRNRTTKLTGAMYHFGDAAGAFTLDTEWDSEFNKDF